MDDPKHLNPQIRILFNSDEDFQGLFNLIKETFKTPKTNQNQTDFLNQTIPDHLRAKFSNFIIHIHGGAFIASSSDYHQSYLRQITRSTGVPIFSIDYGLAPTSPFPMGLEDCFSAVCFIFQFVRNILRIDIKSYALMGDSSGGNFAFGTLQWIIES